MEHILILVVFFDSNKQCPFQNEQISRNWGQWKKTMMSENKCSWLYRFLVLHHLNFPTLVVYSDSKKLCHFRNEPISRNWRQWKNAMTSENKRFWVLHQLNFLILVVFSDLQEIVPLPKQTNRSWLFFFPFIFQPQLF